MWLDKLNEMKRKSNKTTDEISQLSGIPKGTLNKVFAGQTKDPQLSTVKAIVHCLGYTLDDLYDDIPLDRLKNTATRPREHETIKKYLALSTQGKELVDIIVDSEYKRGGGELKEPGMMELSIVAHGGDNKVIMAPSDYAQNLSNIIKAKAKMNELLKKEELPGNE